MDGGEGLIHGVEQTGAGGRRDRRRLGSRDGGRSWRRSWRRSRRCRGFRRRCWSGRRCRRPGRRCGHRSSGWGWYQRQSGRHRNNGRGGGCQRLRSLHNIRRSDWDTVISPGPARSRASAKQDHNGNDKGYTDGAQSHGPDTSIRLHDHSRNLVEELVKCALTITRRVKIHSNSWEE